MARVVPSFPWASCPQTTSNHGSFGAIDAALASSSGCSAYYGNFFNVENVELQNEGADPLVKFSGFCSDAWLTTIAATIAVKTVFQLFMLVLCLQMLVAQLGGGDQKELKADA